MQTPEFASKLFGRNTFRRLLFYGGVSYCDDSRCYLYWDPKQCLAEL